MAVIAGLSDALNLIDNLERSKQILENDEICRYCSRKRYEKHCPNVGRENYKMKQISEHILALRKALHDHNYRYYVLDDPIISDYEFDQKI